MQFPTVQGTKGSLTRHVSQNGMSGINAMESTVVSGKAVLVLGDPSRDRGQERSRSRGFIFSGGSGLLTTTKAHEETDICAYTFKSFGAMRITCVLGRGYYVIDTVSTRFITGRRDHQFAAIRGFQGFLASPERTGENSQRRDIRGIPRARSITGAD